MPVVLEAQAILEGQVLSGRTRAAVLGANIVVRGTDEGGASDSKGQFRFTTTSSYPLTLDITHIAYKPLDVIVASDTTLILLLTPTHIMGEGVLVTAPHSRAAADVRSAIEIVTAEAMENLGARDVGDVLRPLPSVTISVSATGKQTVSIRGSNANEVAIFLDGLRLNDANSGVADLSSIDMNDLERVEVIKGGATTLFGSGAFGGVVSMTSRRPDSNQVAFYRGYGLTDSGDQDLSASASTRLGPLAVGGRFSGKARRYDGNVLYTKTIGSLAAVLTPRFGDLTVKQYYLNNVLELPTGQIAQSDQTTLTIASYTGSLLGSPDWALFLGRREWGWEDKFFTNLERDLAESGLTARLSRQVNSRRMSSTFQLDYEKQLFNGTNSSFDSFGGSRVEQSSRLARSDWGYSAVLRFLSDDVHPLASKIRWEFGLRGDRIDTKHNVNSFKGSTLGGTVDTVWSLDASIPRGEQSLTRRVGVYLEGSTPLLYYTMFMNQGRNQRLPSLNDLSLWANSVDDIDDADKLAAEFLITTDVGAQVIIGFLTQIDPTANLKATASLFVNQYSNKITYRFLSDTPPVPLNTPSARVAGYDLSLEVEIWLRRLRARWAYQRINLDNPFIFPNKPEARLAYQVELRLGWISGVFDYHRDGPQFVVFNGLATPLQLERRESANLNLILRRQLWHAKVSVAYTIRNLFSDLPVLRGDPAEEGLPPPQYYESHRQIISLRVSL